MRILVALVFFCALAIFYHVHTLNTQLIESTSKQSAQQYAQVLRQFRTLYTDEVVQTALSQGIKVTHDYKTRGDAIPLPVTLSMKLAEKMGLDGMGVKARLYSAYPFPWRQKSGGLQDDFSKKAWHFLNKNKQQPFVRIEQVAGIKTVRFAVADLMRPQCVQCHNTHPDSPKRDWKINEVRGVLEVSQPLTLGQEQVDRILLDVIMLVTLLLVLVFSMIALMINHLRRANQSTLQLHEQLSQEIKDRKAVETLVNTSKDEATLANNTKATFLANISHEIRTPMNAIMGYSQILSRDSTINDEHRQSLKAIEQSSVHLLALINDVLDISKVESGVEQVNTNTFDLVALLTGLCDLFSLKTQQKGLTWHVDLDFIQPAVWVNGDEAKLRQILINIIGNAVKFTDKGFVELSVSERTEGAFYFEISDSGSGIAAKEQNALFEPFCQGDAGLEKGGTGLGLTISKKYLELMNSSLLLKSKTGEGTTISFYLDLSHCDAPQSDTVAQRSYKCLSNRQHISVLVVDDIDVNRQVLARILQDAQFSVSQASCALMALDMMNNASFDLILTDIAMPEIDGIALMQRGAKSKLNHHTPVIAISASSLQQDKDHYIKLGFADYIPKPFLIDDLFCCIAQTLLVEFDCLPTPKTEVVTTKTSTTQNTVLIPDKAFIAQLRAAAEDYRISEIEAQLASLTEQSTTHNSFIKIIKGYIAQYDMDALMAYLDQHL